MTGQGHATLDSIAAYHAGTLAPEAEARLQEHLVDCRECTALLLERDDFARILAQAEETPEVTPEAAPPSEAEWQAMRALLPGLAAEPAAPPAPLPFARPIRREFRSARPWQAALAASLLACAGLALWSGSLYRTVGELSRPQVNAPIRDLSPSPRRGAGDAALLTLPPGTRFFTLVLGPAGDESFPDWEAEISRGGTIVWRGRGLKPNDFRSFSLTLPRRLLPEGEYRIVLFGVANGGAREIAEYPLRIATGE